MVKFPFSKTIKYWLRYTYIAMMLKFSGWIFSKDRIGMITSEWFDWEKNYLPVNVKGKVVLDVGAGEGETAMFYLKHGAKKVICVEVSKDRCKYLQANALNNPIEVVNAAFDPNMLGYFEYDFLKMDIEGYEEAILDLPLKVPAVIEVHGLQLLDKFQAKNYRRAPYGLDWYTSYVYSGC